MLAIDNGAVLRKLGSHRTFVSQVEKGHTTPAEIVAGLKSRIEDRVREFSQVSYGLHPFDVVEALRRHEFPSDLEDYRETEDPGLSVAIELAAMLVREPVEVRASTIDFVADLGPAVERLSQLAHEIISCIDLIARHETSHGNDATAYLSSNLFSRMLMLRGNQYSHIERNHCRRFLSAPHIEVHARQALGLTYDEATIVLDASEALYSERLEAALHELNQLVDTKGADFVEPASPAGYLLRSLYAEMGRLGSFTEGDLVTATGLSPAIVRAALDLLSHPTGSVEPLKVVERIASGRDPMRGKAYLRLDQRYVLVNTAAATDRLRDTFENALKSNPRAQNSYNKWRGKQAEGIAVELLEQILGVPATYTSLKYRSKPSPSDPAPELAEADALFIFDSVALIVEVKSASFSSQARAGDPVRLVTDLRKTVGHGATQAARLEQLAREDGGVVSADGSWLDLSQIVDVHMIVVSAEELGRAAIDIDALVRSGVIPEDTLPWVVSLHDLAVIAEIDERPPAFLLYLRQRTSPQISRLFNAGDELDLYILFLRGHLWAMADPRVLAAKNPMSAHVTSGKIARYEKQPEIVVQSQTDDLAAWMYYKQGQRSTPAPRPALHANRRLLEIVDFLIEEHKPGWFEFGADLLDGGPKAQKVLASALDELLRRANADGAEHSVARGLSGHWGYSMFVATVALNGETSREGMERMGKYLLLKKYQMRAPRALGLVFSPSGQLFGAEYVGGSWKHDPDGESLLAHFKLKNQRGAALPPSAKRRTRRLRV
ncbi:hypothetical protein [Mycetocola manganoxydans]|uniref:hypothetical protein n=1 Tax=Mycetocola manganoxydans TaxID=699879 RepID=UPI0011C36C60|nr:hypothetical protein [Mycetocola manganoxydans]